MRAFVAGDARNKISQLDGAVGVVHSGALTGIAVVCGGEARATCSPIAFRLSSRSKREVLALVTDGSSLVRDDTGSLS